MLLLIGATGTVGSHVARALAQRDDVRALAHNDASAQALRHGGLAEVVRGDLAAPAALPPAFAGVDRVFLLTPYLRGHAELELHALDAAREAGVRHVVKVSVSAVGHDVALARGHAEVERRLAAEAMTSTVLRPEPYATNLLLQADAMRAGTLAYPAGTARVAHVDPRDVAAAAVAALTAAEPPSGMHVLTGPEALTYDEVAARASAVLGRAVRYADVPAPGWRDALVAAGVPGWLADDFAELFTGFVAARSAVAPTNAVEALTGRPPRPLEAVLGEHLAVAVPG